MFLSTTVVTYNRASYTQRTIESYIKHTKIPHELIVIDNGSTDGQIQWLEVMKRKGLISDLILSDENLYPGRATNIAWSYACQQATHLHRSDNDIEYYEGWDEEVMQAFKDVPNIGQLGLINELYQMQPKDHESYLESIGIKPIEMGKTKVMYPPNPQGTVGGPCVVPRMVFYRGYHWPETKWSGRYNEDAEYSAKIRAGGMGVVELMSDRVRHLGFGDIQKYPEYYKKTFEDRDSMEFYKERLRLEKAGRIKNGKVTD